MVEAFTSLMSAGGVNVCSLLGEEILDFLQTAAVLRTGLAILT
jgi:hypothetical protein